METASNTITMGQPTLYRVPCHNVNDLDRAFNIEANVTIEDGVVTQMQDGFVRDIEIADPSGYVAPATFSFYGRRGVLNVQFATNVDPRNVAIIEAINRFCEQVDAAVTPTE